MLLVQVNDFSASTDNKPFFDQPLKSKKEAYQKLIEMSKNITLQMSNCTTGNLLDYLYHQKCYKLIGTDLSRQTNRSTSQQINFVGKLEVDDDLIMIFISEKQQKTILNFFLDLLIVTK